MTPERYHGAGLVVGWVVLTGIVLLAGWFWTSASTVHATGTIAAVRTTSLDQAPITRTARLLIETSPPQAEVFVDGAHVGRSPIRVSVLLASNTAVEVEVRAAGRTARRQVTLGPDVEHATVEIALPGD